MFGLVTWSDPSAWYRVITVIPRLVYMIKNEDLKNWKVRISDALATVTHNFLHNTWRGVKHRLDICHASRVAHIEVSLGSSH